MCEDSYKKLADKLGKTEAEVQHMMLQDSEVQCGPLPTIRLKGGWTMEVGNDLGRLTSSPTKPVGMRRIIIFDAQKEISVDGSRVEFTNSVSCKKDYLFTTCDHFGTYRRGNSAYCAYCGYRIGWWCENAPSNTCDYYDKEKGTYTPDSCIYCEEPSDRK